MIVAVAAMAWTAGCSREEEAATPATAPAEAPAAEVENIENADKSATTVVPAPAPAETPEAAAAPNDAGLVTIIIDTNRGRIKAVLWADKAPRTVANFLRYVDAGFFDGLIFHRVMKGFMIQGGGFEQNLQKKATSAPIRNEASADLRNDRGTLAMARTGQPHSATAQFYINLVNNVSLNYRGPQADKIGYCVFGKVVSGMDVVDKIAAVTVRRSQVSNALPTSPVIIKSIRRAPK